MSDVIHNVDMMRTVLAYLNRAPTAGEPKGPYKTLGLHLFVNDISPSPQTVTGDFTEATFAGYVNTTVGAFNDPIEEQDDGSAYLQQFYQQVATGATVQEVVYGWYATGAAMALVASQRFDNPVPINDEGDGVSCIIKIRLPTTLQP